MSNNALRTVRKVWKQIKYNFEDRNVLKLGSANDDAEQIKEIDADQIKDIEKAINDAIRNLMATGSWPAPVRAVQVHRPA
jgi:DNA polymerase/3'-5' exonuclease PolX